MTSSELLSVKRALLPVIILILIVLIITQTSILTINNHRIHRLQQNLFSKREATFQAIASNSGNILGVNVLEPETFRKLNNPQLIYGLEVNNLGNFLLDIIEPWQDGKVLVGYISVALDINALLSDINRQDNFEAIFTAKSSSFITRQADLSNFKTLLGKSSILLGSTVPYIPAKLGYFLDHENRFRHKHFWPNLLRSMI